ncbi:nucleotidyltransferase domain-containing protein [Acholeplasma equirhinis]|uniref:nucleotidyltransferase family protein n=1 Tax=Acholeplasma equirhinis TaxID=555393 RepID=UPI00197A8095|nr:nucleotidyltransferase domain-containing protein [Acholeplasma equirhinis]MBN3490249.1 nucleotidyltransferase domain-containing protein [Acholeplasma equirhinis]
MHKVNQIEKSTEYNPKINARIIRYLSHDKPFLYEEINDTKKELFDALLDAFLRFKSEPLTKASILEMYESLTGLKTDIDDMFITKILEIRKMSDIIKCFIEIIKSKLFLEHTHEMAKLIFNRLLIENGYCPMIFYPNVTKQVITYINENASDEVLDILFHQLYALTAQRLNQKQIIKTQDEVINILLKHKDMIKDLYGVISVGFFGSFARGDQNEYSDIDVWIKTATRINFTKRFAIRSLLQIMLGVKVDLNIWTRTLSETVFHDSLTIF